ncbi:MAG: recombinase family protein [Candidatus Schekmanbacteria bacterium]|nr:recombinase family protein [Candidatus Schekmanbacteria bacterium]
MTMKVAFYTRISTDEEHQKYSLKAQRDRLEAYCNSQYDHWELHQLYSDTEIGTKLERTALQEMLRHARQKDFDVLLVFKVDRLSRNVRQLSQMVDELTKLGIILKSVSEPFDTSNPAGKMMLQMLGVFAEFEHATIVQRTKMGMQKKAKNGEWCGGTIPYGYNLEEEKGLVISEEQAPVVRLIYDLYAVKRLGGVTIAKHLNAKGYRRRSGKLWQNKAVLELIKRHFYCGMINWGGVVQEGIHAAIIDKKQWDLAQAIMKERAGDVTAKLSNRSQFLLTGNIYCNKCGHKMSGSSGRKNGQKMIYYVCTNRQQYGKGQCDQDYIRADHLENAILEQIRNIVRDKEIFAEIIKRANEKLSQERPSYQATLKTLDSKIAKVKKALEKYFKAFESGELKAQLCGNRLEDLDQELRQLMDERKEVAGKADEVTIRGVEGKQVELFLNHFEDIIKNAPFSQRKHFIKMLVPRIVVYTKEEIEVFFRAPLSLVRVTSSLAPRRRTLLLTTNLR